ncbi:MAG: signal peptide peptidase SppA [Holosporales bacterium]|nr:signal peptide peptidase SppA [Holosporales bacterium]
MKAILLTKKILRLLWTIGRRIFTTIDMKKIAQMKTILITKKILRLLWTIGRRTFMTIDRVIRICVKTALYASVFTLVILASWYQHKQKGFPEHAILEIGLAGPIPEGYSHANHISALFLRDEQSLLFGEYLEALWSATQDPRIAGVFVALGSHGPTFSQAQELREVFLALQAEGKPVWVHADSFDTATYYCASSATNIGLSKGGCCAPTGFAVLSPFAKEGLDKLGVEAFSVRREEYKDFGEMFTSTKASAAAEEAYASLLDTWKKQLEGALARDARLTTSSITSFIDNAPYTATRAQALGAVHQLWTRQEYRTAFKGYMKKNTRKSPHYTGIYRYLSVLSEAEKNAPEVAVIYLRGEITDEEDSVSRQSISAEMLSNALREAGKDQNIKAIVLRINSSGGSLTGSHKLSTLITTARHKYGKPIVVSMGTVAASGGYWISAPADYIVATPATLTGSIGVINVFFSTAELMQKLGIAWEVRTSHKNAAYDVGVKPFSEEAKARVSEMVDEGYSLFIEHVACCRKRSITEIEAVAKGRVWTGEQAHAYHLIDKMGGLHTAIREACRLANIDAADVCWRHITETSDPWTLFKIFMKKSVRMPLLSALDTLRTLYFPFQLQAKQEMAIFSPGL